MKDCVNVEFARFQQTFDYINNQSTPSNINTRTGKDIKFGDRLVLSPDMCPDPLQNRLELVNFVAPAITTT